MKKSFVIIAVIIGCFAITSVLVAVFGVFNFPNDGKLTEVSVVTTPEQSAQPTSEPTPEPTPAPTPVPTPVPLGLHKKQLSVSMLAPATTMTFEELVGDNGIYDDEDEIPPIPPNDTYKMIINEYHQFATVYKQDESGEYTVPVRYIVVTTGARSLPTPKGSFSMGNKYVRFGLFASFGVYGQYWRDITGSIFCHSLIYSSRNANSYTNSYNHLGERASHGCVRMLVPDARWVYYNIAPGTSADIIRGDKDDEEAAAIKAQLVYPEKPSSRPGLKPGEIIVSEAWPGWQGNAEEQYSDYLETLETEVTVEDGETGEA